MEPYQLSSITRRQPISIHHKDPIIAKAVWELKIRDKTLCTKVSQIQCQEKLKPAYVMEIEQLCLHLLILHKAYSFCFCALGRKLTSYMRCWNITSWPLEMAQALPPPPPFLKKVSLDIVQTLFKVTVPGTGARKFFLKRNLKLPT